MQNDDNLNSSHGLVQSQLRKLDSLVQKKNELISSLKITLQGEDGILFKNGIALSLLKDTIEEINTIQVTNKIAWSKVVKELSTVMKVGELTVSTVKHRINKVQNLVITAGANGISGEKLLQMKDSDIQSMMAEFKLKQQQLKNEISVIRSQQYQEQLKQEQKQKEIEKTTKGKDKIIANIIKTDREDREEHDLALESEWLNQGICDLTDTLEVVKQNASQKQQPLIDQAIEQTRNIEKRFGMVSDFLPLSVSAKADAKKIVSAQSSRAQSIASQDHGSNSVGLGVTFRRTTARIFKSLLGANENDNTASGLDLSENSPLRKSKPGPKPKNRCRNCKEPTAKSRLVQGLCQECVVGFRREEARKAALKKAGVHDDGSKDLTILDGADGGDQDDGSNCMINNDSDSDEDEDQDQETVEI